jgi:hypothetical protein
VEYRLVRAVPRPLSTFLPLRQPIPHHHLAWVNDEHAAPAWRRNDPYEVFRRMLARLPPNEWTTLVRNSGELSGEILSPKATLKSDRPDKQVGGLPS